jgi:hypothetical protein
LLAEYASKQTWRQGAIGSDLGEGWTSWVADVLAIEVDVQHSGRAVLRSDRYGLEATFRFVPTGKRRGNEPFVALQEIRISTNSRPPNLVPEWVDLTTYFAAFIVEMERIRKPRAKAFFQVKSEPEPGRPPARDYYAAILSEYEALKAAGQPSAAKEMAERHGIRRETMRTRLKTAARLDRELREQRRG